MINANAIIEITKRELWNGEAVHPIIHTHQYPPIPYASEWRILTAGGLQYGHGATEESAWL